MIKPVYSPHLDRFAVESDASPAIPNVYMFVLESRCAKLSNLVFPFRCSQFNQMLLSAVFVEKVSPPLRPARPSSLYSPYVGAVPYIGAWPYVVVGSSCVFCKL